MKSAMAEETLLTMALREPALLDEAAQLKPENFSSGLLGKVFGQLQQRHSQGLEVSVAVLEDLSGEEMSHIAGVAQKELGPVNEQAFADCVRTILAEHQAASVSNEDDLIAYQKKLKERKGIKG
jgi:DNA primase